MEYWNTGMMECWNIEITKKTDKRREEWNIGKMN